MDQREITAKISSLYARLLSLAEESVKESHASFPSALTKIYYLLEQSPLDEEAMDGLQKIIFMHGGGPYLGGPNAHQRLINLLRDAEENIAGLETGTLSEVSLDSQVDKSLDLQCTFEEWEEKGKNRCLIRVNHRGDSIQVLVNDFWASLPKQLWKGCKLNLLSLEPNSSEKNEWSYSFTRRSIMVVEPDYLIDVSEIASCFDIKGASIGSSIFKRYEKDSTSIQLLLGSMINTIFDELLVDDSRTFDELYDIAVAGAGLTLFHLAKQGKISQGKLRSELEPQFEVLKDTIQNYKGYINTSEPSFISTRYGLQGRLDLMVETENDSKVKDIVELKSGRPINGLIKEPDKRGNIRFHSIWPSHEAQLTGYDILLDSAYKGRKGSSFVLYSKLATSPVKNTLRTATARKKFIFVRNKILISEYQNSDPENDDYEFLKQWIDYCPKYSSAQLTETINLLSGMEESAKNYFRSMSSFISREIFAGRTGHFSQKSSSQSSLWSGPSEGSAILHGLKVEEIESGTMYLTLSRSDSEDTPLRKGDAVFLYNPSPDYSDCEEFFQGQVVKASIKAINIEMIVISLRNKLLNLNLFSDKDATWSISADYFDTGLKRLHKEVFRFATSEDFPFYSGNEIPALPEKYHEEIKTSIALSDEQRALLSRALAAPYYFFLQGPPGTGKTKYFLKALIEQLALKQNKKILLCSFTNRAVDEATTAALSLNEINPEHIIRIGSAESSEHIDLLLSTKLKHKGPTETYKSLNDVKIVSATISSCISNKEIFEIFEPDIAIVDEAGQIAESYTNVLLGRFKKIIFIGDVKQLPPIILADQEPNLEKKEQEELKGSAQEQTSYFARMTSLISNKEKEVKESFSGMLTRQGRMDQSIMHAANRIAYGDKLSSINPFSISDSAYAGVKAINIVSTDGRPKESMEEAREVIATVKAIISGMGEQKGNTLDKNSIGIISPFRKQCSIIKESLDYELWPYIHIDTVERFQGSERSHIIFSACIHSHAQLEMILSPYHENGESIDRKLNVALTRAKHSFTLIGNMDVLKADSSYRKLIEYASSQATD